MSGLDGTAPLAVVERGGRVESVHDGAVAVVDADGSLVAWAGSPGLCAFTRSALKPLQAFPFVAAGGPKHFGLSSEQVALLCASHSGEAKHQVAVADLLRRAGVAPDELGCGTHAPYVYDTLHEAPPPPPYSPLGHNCSGKHAGMLAFCAMCGWPRASYLDPAHPVQAAIRDAIARLAGVGPDTLVPAIDGCSAPNYALPLASLARAFARIARGTGDADDGACRRIADAMAAHPDYVSGEGRSDLKLMRAGRGPLDRQGRRRGHAGDRASGRGPRHRDQGGRRRRASGAPGGHRRPRRARRPRRGRKARPGAMAGAGAAQCAGHGRRTGASGGCPGQGTRGGTEAAGELGDAGVVFVGKRVLGRPL
jgi:L-asparaginase II